MAAATVSNVCQICGSYLPSQATNMCSFCCQASTVQSGDENTCEDISTDDEEGYQEEEGFNEEEVIRYYFCLGFEYKEILHFLSERHQHPISRCTLLRRLKQYGLSRRGISNKEGFSEKFAKVQERISELIQGPSSSMGYRAIWHTLRMEGILVPRKVVQDLLKEMDPEGTEKRKKNRLKRRHYNSPGPNYAWHMDGYDKLKHWGFPIHGGIDGFSRKILWLKVTRSNNSPDNIASFFLDTISAVGGCPIHLITDLGTENGLSASIQNFFRDDLCAHKYVSSPRNQRIEGWWSYFSKSHSLWWRRFFTDLEFQGIIDTSSELVMECLWFCFHEIIQKELDYATAHWNTHRIRRSRHNTVPGRPDSLFFSPELHGADPNLIMEVPLDEMNHALQHLVARPEKNIYEEYFGYAQEQMSIEQPSNWQEALALFKALIQVAK